MLAWAERADETASYIGRKKRLNRWRREWKFALIERGNPDWNDLAHLHG